MRTGAFDILSPGLSGRIRPDDRLNKARKARLRWNALEWLESRTLLSVLPPATATGAPIDVSAQAGGNAYNQSSPTVAIDRYDPQKLVSVWGTTDPTLPPNDQTIVQGGYSIDGGADWVGFNATIGAQIDPTSTATLPATFSFIGNPSVAFDANNDAYVLAQQTNTANTAGELILTKFDFSGDTPVVVPYQQPVTHTVNDYQIVREYIGDPLFNPTMAVDDNLATYSDPVTNVAQNDPYSGNVYIAWNTDETAPTGATNWNPNSIQMVSSSDGGQTFSNPLRMNVAGNYSGGTYGTQRETTPRLVVSQGRAPGTDGPNEPGVPGGQVTAVWDNYGNYGDGLDRLMSNRVTNGSVTDLESKVYPAPVTLSGIATDLPQLVPLAGTTRTTSTITLNSFPAGYLISNIQVTIGDLQYSPVGPLTIKLIAPDGTSDILFQTPNDYGGSNFENTLFTDSATTSIILGTAPYPGPFLHTDSQFIPLDVTNVAPDPTSSVGPSTGWFGYTTSNVTFDPTKRSDGTASGITNFTGTYSYLIEPKITTQVQYVNNRLPQDPIGPISASDIPPQGLPVPQSGGYTESTITLAGYDNQLITGIDVNFTIAGSHDGNLTISLIAPNGRSVVLYQNSLDGTTVGFDNVTFSDFGSASFLNALPPANTPYALDSFIYVGTQTGQIYVTQTRGGTTGQGNAWTLIGSTANGLDGSAIQQIVANPTRGSHEAYAVTSNGVYWIADSLATGAQWINITGNLHTLAYTVFGAGTALNQALSLTAIVADWRYTIPDDPTKPDGPVHPILYVSANSGVYRSLDKGQTWTMFPNTALDGAPVDGGFLPNANVTDLSLSLGNIDPNTGMPNLVGPDDPYTPTPAGQPGDPDILLATTYGRGSFAIRTAPLILGDEVTVSPTTAGTGTDSPPVVTGPITISGSSEISGFGNATWITVEDVTNPANPVVIAGFNPADPVPTPSSSNSTNALGNFSITFNPASYYMTNGPKTIEIFATDNAGSVGNKVTYSFTLG